MRSIYSVQHLEIAQLLTIIRITFFPRLKSSHRKYASMITSIVFTFFTCMNLPKTRIVAEVSMQYLNKLFNLQKYIP